MRDLIIYFAGGTMTGIFGAGVGTSFLRKDLYPRLKAVYGVSAGIWNGCLMI